jgi:hypothetical protein
MPAISTCTLPPVSSVQSADGHDHDHGAEASSGDEDRGSETQDIPLGTPLATVALPATVALLASRRRR